jgi:antirestriction protein ArdC
MTHRERLHLALDTVFDLSAARGKHKKALEEAIAHVKAEYPKYVDLVDKITYKPRTYAHGNNGLYFAPPWNKIELYPQNMQNLTAAYVETLRHELEHAMQHIVAGLETKLWPVAKRETEAFRAGSKAHTKYLYGK